jgi:hypothetical protein
LDLNDQLILKRFIRSSEAKEWPTVFV